MTDRSTRRRWLTQLGTTLGASVAIDLTRLVRIPPLLPPRGLLPAEPLPTRMPLADGEIESLTSTSEVTIPPRGNAFQKFSFDFPEPSVAFGGLRVGFMVFTYENAYGLDRERMHVTATADGLQLLCDRFIWAGGQQRADGHFEANFRRDGEALTWTARVTAPHPVRAITSVVRGVPRGALSPSGQTFFDPKDDEVMLAYPFSGGDLFGPNGAGGMTTPQLFVRRPQGDVWSIASRDPHVRTKRFYLQPGATGYRLELVHEPVGWVPSTAAELPEWRVERASSLQEPARAHYAFLEKAHAIPSWDTRADVPGWMRETALVVTLHGMHYTGFIFNDYARQLEILEWIAARIPGPRVLAFLASWDGRYYWDYPRYQPEPRMGGSDGLHRLVDGAHRLGVKVMPMFGANSANRKQPSFSRFADASTAKPDGDSFDINWVDWDNDRHQDGWLAYMNLGVPSWRNHLTARISAIVREFGADAYFLDIAGGWVNNTRADMHDGTRLLVQELRRRHPTVAAVGEMHYDALLAFIPMYHSFSAREIAPIVQHYSRYFQHLSHPAPGRGSSGVHESGFGEWDAQSLSLSEYAIPTLNVVDDTFVAHQDEMAAVIRRARERAGI